MFYQLRILVSSQKPSSPRILIRSSQKSFLYTFYNTGHHIFSRSSTKEMASPCVICSSPNTNSVALFATTKHLKFNDGQRSTRHWLASGSNQLHALKNSAIQSTSRPNFRQTNTYYAHRLPPTSKPNQLVSTNSPIPFPSNFQTQLTPS